jgi:hypothetical protein
VPPSSRATIKRIEPPRERKTPRRSIWRRLDALNLEVELGKMKMTNAMMNAPVGTFIQKTHYLLSV